MAESPQRIDPDAPLPSNEPRRISYDVEPKSLASVHDKWGNIEDEAVKGFSNVKPEDLVSDGGSSHYTWNSDDDPPDELVGEEFICTKDKLVRKRIVSAGVGQERPGGMDMVCLEFRQDIQWYQLGKDELPCGIEAAVRKMRKREVAEVLFHKAYAKMQSPSDVGDKKRFLPGLKGYYHVEPKSDNADDAHEDEDDDEGIDVETGSLGDLPSKPKADKKKSDINMKDMLLEEISVLDIQPIDILSHDKKIRKQRLHEGIKGYGRPQHGDQVDFAVYEDEDRTMVKYKSVCELVAKEEAETPGTKEGETPVATESGSFPGSVGLQKGLFLSLKSMRPGEVAKVTTEGESEVVVQLRTFKRRDFIPHSYDKAKEISPLGRDGNIKVQRGIALDTAETNPNLLGFEETASKKDVSMAEADGSRTEAGVDGSGKPYDSSAKPEDTSAAATGDDDVPPPLEAFIRKESLVDNIQKLQLQASPQEFISQKPEEYANVMVALSVPGVETKVVSFRVGDGTVPFAIDTCIKSMSLFEDSEFTIGGEHSVLFPDAGDNSVLRPLSDLTQWLKDVTYFHNVQDPEHLEDSEKNRNDLNHCVKTEGLSSVLQDIGGASEQIAQHRPAADGQKNQLEKESQKHRSWWANNLQMEIKNATSCSSTILPFNPPSQNEHWMDVNQDIGWDMTAFKGQKKLRIWLLGMIPSPDVWLMDSSQLIVYRQRCRLIGNKLALQSCWKEAMKYYDDAIYSFSVDAPAVIDQANTVDKTTVANKGSTYKIESNLKVSFEKLKQDNPELLISYVNLQNNIALCQFKQQEYRVCRLSCDKVLAIDETNNKALARKVQASETIGMMEDALEKYQKLRPVDYDKGIANWATRWINEQDRREQALFTKMFAKKKNNAANVK